MTETANFNVWHLLFEQTPPLLRWLLGILTLGLFTLAGWLYRRERQGETQSRHRVETQLHSRVSRLEERLDRRLERIESHLVHIAENTRRED